MNARAITITILAAVILTACSTMTPDERHALNERAHDVRITRDVNDTRGCQRLGETNGHSWRAVNKRVALMGGDVALVTAQRRMWYTLAPWKVSSDVSVYSCSRNGDTIDPRGPKAK